MLTTNILVIGDYPQTLAVVRSLGRAGFRVTLADHKTNVVAAHSRHCAAFWRCSDLQSTAFADQLSSFLERTDNVVAIFPVGIAEIQAVGKLQAATSFPQAIIGVRPKVVEVFDEKLTANSIAESAGVLAPAAEPAENKQALYDAVYGLGFPVIIKSPINAGPVFGRKAFILESAEELEHYFEEWPPEHSVLMVQRYIMGSVKSCDFVAKDGQIVAYYEGNADETDAMDGTGVVVNFRSVQPTPQLFEALRKIVLATTYSGPGLLQCILSNDGKCHFVELNPRLSAGIAEAVNANLDLPLIALTSALHAQRAVLNAPEDALYDKNSKTYWLERDFQGLLRNRKALSLAQIGGWFVNMIRRLILCNGHINWSWRDPLPSLYILARALRLKL